MPHFIDWDSDHERSVKNAYADLYDWVVTRFGHQTDVTLEQYQAFWEDFNQARATIVRGLE